MSLRRLPVPEGQSCFVGSEDEDSPLSRIADYVEATMLREARSVAAETREVIRSGRYEPGELVALMSRMHDALVNATHLAEIQGSARPCPKCAEGGAS